MPLQRPPKSFVCSLTSAGAAPAVRLCGHHVADGQLGDVLPVHRVVARQPLVLGRDLARLVLEAPWRIGEEGAERSASELVEVCHGHAACLPWGSDNTAYDRIVAA